MLRARRDKGTDHWGTEQMNRIGRNIGCSEMVTVTVAIAHTVCDGSTRDYFQVVKFHFEDATFHCMYIPN